MVIVCTRDRRNKELANIATTTGVWAMYNLLMVHNTTVKSIKTALVAWFSVMHKTADIDYSAYD